jgi:hypothetical protein
MKHIMLIAHFLMMIVSAAALAQDEQDCVSLSAGLGFTERAAFLKGCLGKKSAPASVEEAVAQRKRLNCEQNAKNKSLLGKASVDYVDTCMAEAEAKQKWAKIMGKNSS